MRVKQIREKFFEFYKRNEFRSLPHYLLTNPLFPHTFLPSAVFALWVPEIEKKEVSYSMRIQKCVRATDMNMIKTGSHLTFFEMACAVALTKDYERYQEKIIEYCYSFLTKELQIDNKNLWVTVFKGDNVFDTHCPVDKLSRKIFINLGIPEERIVPYGKKGNFTGSLELEPVLGPLTEIFYDKGEGLSCQNAICLPGHSKSCKRFMELANIAIMVYDKRNEDGEIRLVPRKKKVIGSAIGVERVASITQNKLRIGEIEEIDSLSRNILKLKRNNDESISMIDCIRTLVFLIADGGKPGHGGRNYIVKKFIRRYLTYLKLMNIPCRKTERIVEDIITEYGNYYENLRSKQTVIMETINEERTNFERNLRKAFLQLDKLLRKEEVSKAIEILTEKYGIDPKLARRHFYRRRRDENRLEAQFK